MCLDISHAYTPAAYSVGQAGVTMLTSSLSSPLSHSSIARDFREKAGCGEEREGGGRGTHCGFLVVFLHAPQSSTMRGVLVSKLVHCQPCSF